MTLHAPSFELISLSIAAEEVTLLHSELEEAKKSREELQTLLDVAGGELDTYKHKICDFEGVVASKKWEFEVAGRPAGEEGGCSLAAFQGQVHC